MQSSKNYTQTYLQQCKKILDTLAQQENQIHQAANWFAETILAGRMVHLFGSGHSRIMVEEMWPRYGSFPGFNPLVELSLTYHNAVVGSNGQRQAMFLENVMGLAKQILRNFDLSAQDSGLVISNSGTNIVPIEVAQEMKKAGMPVVAIVGRQHAEESSSKHPDGIKLTDVVDLVLDNGVPAGDSMVMIDQLDTPVSPGSTVGGSILINSIKAEVAGRLTEAGVPPQVLTASCLIGSERSSKIFQSAYDEHAHRLAKLFARVGTD